MKKTGRSHYWQKVINYLYDEVFVIGYRMKEFGWILGSMEDGCNKTTWRDRICTSTGSKGTLSIATGLFTNETEVTVISKTKSLLCREIQELHKGRTFSECLFR